MKLQKLISFLVILLLTGLLVACARNASPASLAVNPAVEKTQPARDNSQTTTLQAQPATLTVQAVDSSKAQYEAVSDDQGAIVVTVRPLNLSEQAKTLDFEVILDTHSVDLSFDLSKLASLTTDTGVTVPAVAWDGPSGGHHVEGKLSFPAEVDGKLVLQGAATLKLVIKDVDTPERSFSWQLPR